MSRKASPNDRMGWFERYAVLWESRMRKGEFRAAQDCEQLALWFFLLAISEEEPAA